MGQSTADSAGEHNTDRGESSDALHTGTLPLIGLITQSVSALAPSTGPALAVGLVALTAGNGTWLTWLIVTAGMLGCAYAFSWLASRFVSTGGNYGIAAQAAGGTAGYFTGVPAMLGLFLVIPVTAIMVAYFLLQFLAAFGVTEGRWLTVLLSAAIVVAGWVLTTQDIRVSALALLLLEGVSLIMIGVLLLLTLVHAPHGIIDHSQLSLSGVSANSLTLSLGLAVFSLAGWDISAMLGREARNPKRGIPIAAVSAPLLVGLLLCVSSYIMILGFEGAKVSVGDNPAPLTYLASQAHVHWMSYLILLCVALSGFSSVLACMNASTRQVYNLSRDQILPRWLSRVSRRNGAPVAAAHTECAIWLAITIVAASAIASPLDAYAYIVTYAGYLILVWYVLFALIALGWAVKRRNAKPLLIVAAIGSSAILLLGLVNAFRPFPVGPYRVVAILFFATLVLVIIAWALIKRSSSQILERIQATASADHEVPSGRRHENSPELETGAAPSPS